MQIITLKNAEIRKFILSKSAEIRKFILLESAEIRKFILLENAEIRKFILHLSNFFLPYVSTFSIATFRLQHFDT